MTSVGSFLRRQRVMLTVFCAQALIWLLVVWLYQKPWSLVTDAWLFSGYGLLIYCVIGIWREHTRLKKLRYLTSSAKARRDIHSYPAAQNEVERAYQEIIHALIIDDERQQHQISQQQAQILDDFTLWLHQIKTPVAALDLMAQSDQLKQAVVRQELFKVNDYLQTMLTYLRENLATHDLVIEKVQLEPLVHHMLKKYAFFFAQKPLSLQLINLDQEIITDKKWCTFILDQVLFNAIKYTQTGTITLEYRDHALSIQDTGVGIRSEDLPRIFEKGFTGLNGRTQQRASGLGLYLSQRAAQQIGCQLTLTSTFHQGTTVTLHFPATLQMDTPLD